MTIFQAEEYDPRKARRRKFILSTAAIVIVVVGMFAWVYRNWPEERIVSKFFTAVENKDFETAYGLWINDKDWKQKPPLARYSFNSFYQDWGPGGEWGLVKSFHIDGSKATGTGVVVLVTVNERKEQARLWVEKDKHTMTFSPY